MAQVVEWRDSFPYSRARCQRTLLTTITLKGYYMVVFPLHKSKHLKLKDVAVATFIGLGVVAGSCYSPLNWNQ